MTRTLRLLFLSAALPLAAAAPALAAGPDGAPRMKAVVRHAYGPADVLRLEDVPRPVPGDDQVLVRVRAAAVNPLDVHYMLGTPYLVRLDAGLFEPENPQLGVDVAGVVEAVGRSVTRFKPGDEVFGHRFGAFAEYAAVRERSLAQKPANVTFEQAAAVPVAAVTALQGLRDKGRLRPGQKVLVNGASGGVGTFAVQIAKALGAEVTGVCSTRNVELVRSLGADHVVDYTREDFTRGPERYDVILDMVATHSLPDYRRVMAPGGVHVLVGSTEKGLWLKPILGPVKAAVYSRFVSQEFVGLLARIDPKDLDALRDLMQAGKVTPVVDRRFALGEVAEAIRYVEKGHARGKVVIAMDQGAGSSPVPAAHPAGPARRLLPRLAAVAVVAAVLLGPLAVALALDRRFRRRNPGKRPYRWGYYLSLEALIGGALLGLALESGPAVAVAFAGTYAVLAWSFARRRRWAWVALTVLTFNPVAWIVNLVYLRRRWREDTLLAPLR